MPKQIQIHIPKPCHQNWNEMDPTQQGAFCKACQKTVIDFSGKTENEIYDIFTGATGSICGRFREDQVDVPITRSEVNASLFNWKAIAASIAVLFTADRSFGAKDNTDKPASINRPPFVFNPPVIEKTVVETTYRMVGEVLIRKPDAIAVKPKKEALLLTIKGRVVDSKSKQPLPGVWISITDSSNLYLYTDKDGYFSIKSSTGAGRINFSRNYDHDNKDMELKELIALQKGSPSKTIEIMLVPHEPIQMKMGKVSRPFP